MSAQSPSSSDPSFVTVELTGPAAMIDQLMAELGGSAEVIFDSQSEPDTRGEVERTARLVTHPAPRPASAGSGVSVTVQSVLEVDSGGAFADLPGKAADKEVEHAVTEALLAVPQVREASSRVVSAWGLPAARE